MMAPSPAPGAAVSAHPLVRIKGITKAFGGVRALRGVSLISADGQRRRNWKSCGHRAPPPFQEAMERVAQFRRQRQAISRSLSETDDPPKPTRGPPRSTDARWRPSWALSPLRSESITPA
jgi:hypothetical protein